MSLGWHARFAQSAGAAERQIVHYRGASTFALIFAGDHLKVYNTTSTQACHEALWRQRMHTQDTSNPVL